MQAAESQTTFDSKLLVVRKQLDLDKTSDPAWVWELRDFCAILWAFQANIIFLATLLQLFNANIKMI